MFGLEMLFIFNNESIFDCSRCVNQSKSFEQSRVQTTVHFRAGSFLCHNCLLRVLCRFSKRVPVTLCFRWVFCFPQSLKIEHRLESIWRNAWIVHSLSQIYFVEITVQVLVESFEIRNCCWLSTLVQIFSRVYKLIPGHYASSFVFVDFLELPSDWFDVVCCISSFQFADRLLNKIGFLDEYFWRVSLAQSDLPSGCFFSFARTCYLYRFLCLLNLHASDIDLMIAWLHSRARRSMLKLRVDWRIHQVSWLSCWHDEAYWDVTTSRRVVVCFCNYSRLLVEVYLWKKFDLRLVLSFSNFIQFLTWPGTRYSSVHFWARTASAVTVSLS